jgi:translocation and assembly module TamA
MVIAARAKLGSIAGADTDSVPASERFYAGGGGSIRGYGYQQVGPVDSNGDPTGGRSLFEVGLETRFRVWGPIGLVTFVEAGDVYESVYPAPFQSVLVGAGFGLRYFTAVGPIRVDLAFPLDRRPGDDPFQFYVSIGQAF